MLNLDRSSLKEPETWTKLGFKLPEFNPQRVADNTAKNPEWVHFGSGNIFRSFIAALNQKLLDEKKTETGIIAVDTYDPEVIKRVYRPHDNMSILVLMNADGTLDKEVIASVGESGGLGKAENCFPFPNVKNGELYHYGEGVPPAQPFR